MMSKSSMIYVRRHFAAAENRNIRESGRIRYENKKPTIARENEPPGMEEYIVFQPNLRSVKGLTL